MKIRLIYHISLKRIIFANVNFYNCTCSNVTISNGAIKSSTHTYITTWIRARFRQKLSFQLTTN
jgi:hypothetical protein